MICDGLSSSDGQSPGSSAGPARWFADHVLPHEAALRGYLRGRFSALPDVDDIVQDTYLRLWKTRHAVRNVRSFLFTTARNLAFDAVRHRGAAPFQDVTREQACSVPHDEPGVGDVVSRQQEVQTLEAAVDALPPRCRETLRLQRLEGLTHREVARRLGISPRTVDSHIQAGVRRCAEYLHTHGVGR